MNQMLARDVSSEPIVITYNDSVSTTNLAYIANTSACGSTDFVKGSFDLFNQINQIKTIY
jgi:hypothetical protein